ncbi:HAMP domain-containing histidine kinase [Kordiimonas sp. SCSIO 12603]|uniref:sensor histidine kinase n=1 Tax=Kordiimonas sp. SCSIO 12603 TaxID=2829596 RepID=UPI0021058BC8|nr:HAMP domain-containing sensor histidine kinase [Kordiimonas sp. SCSIO 12603]UTW57120.1 HAMP domain-containing histidine kinase [Kordiimonas sp. SCSIO 12603]
MVKKHSIQRRIYLLFASFTLFTCLVYSMLLLAYSWVVEDNVFNRIVSDEVQYIEQQFAKTGLINAPRSQFLMLYEGWNKLPEPIYKEHLKDPDKIEFTYAGNTLHLSPLTLGQDTYILVADVSAFEVGGEYLPYVSLSLILVLAIFSALAIAFAWPVASAASKPLIELTEKVETLNLKAFKPGFAKPFPDNEIGYLASEIERSMLHIQTVLKRETDFTRDASHELRTPTTILKNLAAQIETNTPLSAKQHAQFTNAVKDLEQTIDTLLALAREETQKLETITFLHALENAILKNTEIANTEAFQLHIEVPDTLAVTANEQLLSLLINNLLSNVLAHSAEKQLTIRTDGDEIIFENPTTIYPVENPLHDRSKRNDSSGLGLGLYLVERICTLFGWTVSVSTENNMFSVHLKYKTP